MSVVRVGRRAGVVRKTWCGEAVRGRSRDKYGCTSVQRYPGETIIRAGRSRDKYGCTSVQRYPGETIIRADPDTIDPAHSLTTKNGAHMVMDASERFKKKKK